jgi:lipopolysaccharide export LptBFGC system permease protein LptF
MPVRFVLSLTARTVATYLLVTAVICGIYLVEQFLPLLEAALRYAFSTSAFGTLLLLTLPRIIEFALPLAALCVAYFAILDARERRELLVISASGASSTHLAVTALLAGGIAAAISLGISGFAKPVASFAYRSTLAGSVAAALSKEIPIGAFYSQADNVLYSRASEHGPQRLMRLFEFNGDRLRQVLVSDCARMRVVDGVVQAQACDLRGYSFVPLADDEPPGVAQGGEPCTICPDTTGDLTVTRLAAGASTMSFPMHHVFTTPVRDREVEMNLFELLRTDGDRFRSPQFATAAAGKVLSAIACVIGVLLAFVAVAFTNYRTRYLALPLACAAMMGIMVLIGSQSALLGAEAGRSVLFMRLAALALACLPASALTASLVYDRLVTPALAKS